MAPSKYRWVIVAAGGLLGCVAIGAMFSLPVFLRPISEDTGWSMTGVSTAMTIGFVALALASFAWGSLSDRIGPRAVVLTGSIVLAASLALASRATSLLAFQLIFGLAVGGSIAAIFAPMMAAVTGWFDTHRSLAVSLVSAGMGMAPMTMSPLAAWLVTHYDWRTSMLVIAGIAAVVMIPVSFLVRRPPALEDKETVAEAEPQSDISMREALRSPQFIILALTNFFCCATHSGPIFHTVSYAVACGIPLMAAVSIYSMEGLAGLGGRVAFGIAGDRLGAKRVLVFGLLVQAFGTLGYLAARDLGTFLRRRGAVRLHLRRSYAALRGDRPREFSTTDDGDGDRRHDHGRRPRNGHRTGGRRDDLRHLRDLQLAVHRLVRPRHRRLPDRADLQALPEGTADARNGLIGSTSP